MLKLRGTKRRTIGKDLTQINPRKFKFELSVMVFEQTTTEMLC